MNLRMILTGVVVLLAASAALSPVWELFPDGYWEQLTEALGHDARGFVLAVAVAPLVEEFLFRAVLCRGLAAWWKNDVWAIWVSAAIFALAHYPIWPQVPGAVAGGLVLGYAYRITRTIWVPVAVHFVNNLLAWLAWDVEFTAWWLSAIGATIMVLGIVRLHNKLRQNTLLEK